MKVNHKGMPIPGINSDRELATWVHEALANLLIETSSTTRTEIANRIHQIRSVSGLLADQPTDLSAHVGCDLSVTIEMHETYLAHAAPDNYETLLMATQDLRDSQVHTVRTVWCLDHERYLEEDNEDRLITEWS